jgi:D-alanyl-D-alanine carboxypeptidase (penicillin-binding protein 5/6)
MALIAREAVSHDIFKTICSTVTYTVPATNMSEERSLQTTHKLMISDSTYYYQYASGVKTGTTNAAGYCLISTAEKDGISLLAVVMGADSVVADDGTTQVQSFTESRRLYQWAFDSFSYRTILTTSELVKSVPIAMGDGVDSVILRPSEEVTALMDNDIDIENDIQRTITVFSEENGEELTAPLEAGTVLGQITLTYNGNDFATIDLVANTSVSLLKAEYIKDQVKGTLSQTWLRVVIGVILFIFLLYAFLVIRYNIIRRKRRRAARLRRQREMEARRRESYSSTTGKSFEDVYNKYDK